VGIIVRTIDKECRVFKWESNHQEMRIILEKAQNTLDVRSQVELVRLFSETPPAKSIYWEAYSTVWDLRAGGVSYQVSVSIRNKVAMSVSTAPIDSVHVDVSCREYVEGSLWKMSGGEAASWTPFN